MFSLVRYSERNIPSLEHLDSPEPLLAEEEHCFHPRTPSNKDYADIPQIMLAIEAIHAEPQLVRGWEDS